MKNAICSKYAVLAVACIVPVLVACATIHRFHYGADITDEAFYLSTTRSILEWGGPFIMNVNITQLSSLLMAPFLLMFRCFSPGDSNLILAFRYAYLTMTALTAACVFDFAKRRTSLPLAVVLSALPLAWMPFSLPACSYNTFTTNFFSMALLIMTAPPVVSPKRAFLSAILLFLTILGYPTLIVPAVAFYLLIYLTIPKSAKQNEQRKVLGTSFATLIGLLFATAAALVTYEGTEHILKCMEWTRTSVDSNKNSKILFWLTQFSHTGLICRLALASISGLCIYQFPKARLRLPACLILLATCMYAALIRSAPLYYQSHEIIILLVVSALSGFLKRKWAEERNVAITFWTSVLAGIITYSTGTNGLLNFPLGATAAALISLIYLCQSLQKWKPLPAIFALCILSGMIFDFSFTVYGEWGAANTDLTYKIRSGPFKGIFTTQKRGEIITALQNELKEFSNSKSIIYVIGAPGYYLLARQRGLDPFLYHINDRQSQVPFMRKFFAQDKRQPDIIVHVISDEYFGKANAADGELLKRSYVKVKDNSAYVIYINRHTNPVGYSNSFDH